MPEVRFRVMVGRRFRLARVSVGMSVEQFADELGLPADDLVKIEEGRLDPDLVTLIYASRYTGKSIDFLVTGGDFVPV